MACLSSRIPYGEAVTPEKLAMIEQAENVLRDLGFHDVRVRHHELRNANNQSLIAKALPSTFNPQPSTNYLARIELGPAEIQRFLRRRNERGGRSVEKNRLRARHARFAGLPARQHQRGADEKRVKLLALNGFR